MRCAEHIPGTIRGQLIVDDINTLFVTQTGVQDLS